MKLATEKRNRNRAGHKARNPEVLSVELKDGMGNPRWVTADLVDRSEGGLGVSMMTPLKPGSKVMVRGKLGNDRTEVKISTQVIWCVERDGRFRCGFEFVDKAAGGPADDQSGTVDPNELDCYEILQLSPNAGPDTIDRVYRLLAQRYHPDNPQTGSSEVFVKLSEAYRVLSNPERRVQYDIRHRETKRLHWKVFDQSTASTGYEGENRKRRGILELLYAKTLGDPERSTMSIFEFEDLLGCPREHLQAALWYLRGKHYIQRADNGKFTITVEGFDEVEGHSGQTPGARMPVLLESAGQTSL
jgi:DnaJ-like protein/PilZ domain-containing protein